MAKLFKTLNPNFFNILASPNKETYIDCIFIIYDALDSVEDAFQGERNFVVSKLVDYFEDREYQMVAELELASTPRQKAVGVINYLKDCGWIGEEELGDYKTSINFFDYTIKIVEALKAIEYGEQVEYTGEIYLVYSLLNNFEIEEGVGIIEQAFVKTNDIIRKLKSLKANIYRYYYDITSHEKDQDLEGLLEKLLIEYKENFFDHAYYNLKTKDSLPRYKKRIIDSVLKIYNNPEALNQLTLSLMEIKKFDDYDEAFHQIESKLIFIMDSFSAFDNLIMSIDRKNEQYISAAASKILFLTNHSDDIEGIFNRIFKIVVDSDEETFDYAQLFNLIQARNLDTESLHTQRRIRIDSDPEQIFLMDDLISDELKKAKIQILMKNNIYGKKEINKYVLVLLNNESEIEAADVLIDNEEDYIKLVLIFLYSRSIGIDYTIKQLKSEVKSNFVTFNNFLIIRGNNR